MVGITNCNPAFVEDDGECRPTLTKCSPGDIPDVDAGCVPVGILGCEPAFVDPALGVCLPPSGACPAGQLALPVGGCTPIALSSCGVGTWGNIVAQPDDIYVNPSFVGSSNGTRAAPFRTLGDALLWSTDGSRIVLAAGVYPSHYGIDWPVLIEGVCPENVTILGDSPATGALVFQLPPGLVAGIRGVTITGSGPGVVVFEDTSVGIENTRIHDTQQFGVLAFDGSTMVIAQSSIESTQYAGSQITAGVYVGPGADMYIVDSVIRGATQHGVASFGTVSLENTLVEGTTPSNTGLQGFALRVMEGGLANVIGSVLARNFRGTIVSGASDLNVSDSVMADTEDDEIGDFIILDTMSNATIDWSALVRNKGFGVWATQSTVSLNHSWISDTSPGVYDGHGVVSDGPCQIIKSTLSRNVGMAITCRNGANIEGTVIQDVAYGPEEQRGTGMLLFNGPNLVHRTMVTGASEYGMLFVGTTGAPTTYVLASRVEHTTGISGGTQQGVGIGAGTNMSLLLEDTLVEDSRGAGILLTQSTGDIKRTIIRDVAQSALSKAVHPVPAITNQPFSEGILFHAITAAPTVTLEDVWIQGYGRAGMLLNQRAHDLTRVHASGGTYGLVLQAGATATQDMCELSDNSMGSVLDPGSLTLP